MPYQFDQFGNPIPHAPGYGGHQVQGMPHRPAHQQQGLPQPQQPYLQGPFPQQRDGASAPGGPGQMPQGFQGYPQDPRAGAMANPPNLAEILSWGAHVGPSFFPTRPLWSDAQGVAHMPRDYGVELNGGTVGTQVALPLLFSTPCILVAINAGVFFSADLSVGMKPLDTFLIQTQYVNGENIQTTPVLGSTVCGTADLPGEIGGNGRFFSAGSGASILITPLVASLRINVVFRVMELIAPTNYHAGGSAGR